MVWIILALLLSHAIAICQDFTPAEIKNAYHYFHADPHSNKDSLYTLCTSALVKTNDLDPSLKSGLQMMASQLSYENKKYDVSLRYAQAAQAIYQNINPNKNHYWIMYQLGRLLYIRGNYLLAAQHFSDALNTDQIKDKLSFENECRDYVLRIYNLLPNYNLSADFFDKSIEVKSKLGDDKGILMLSQKMAQVYYDKENYIECIRAADMGIRLSKKLNDPDVEFSNSIEKANSLIRLNKQADALSILTELQKKVSPGENYKLYRWHTAWGNYFLSLHDEKLALQHYQSAVPNRSATIEQYIYKHQAQSYKLIGEYKKALEAEEKYVKQVNAGYLSNVLPSVISIEEAKAKSNLTQQIQYLNRQNQLKDSLIKNQNLLSEALASKNKLQQSQLISEKNLSEAIKRDVELQKKQIRDEHTQRLLYALSSMGLLCMGAWVYYLYHKQKNKNDIIEKKSKENELLMKEIHHRVKNNLQIISSLLDMQSISIKENPTATEAIKEGKNRVQSMALIHQNLYHDGNISGIKIDDYLIHLSGSLFDSYHVDQEKIKLLTEIEPLHLDVETVVPIGIIVNELITNCIKYAFKNKNQGSISLSLKRLKQDLHLQLKDSGQGFPSGWSTEQNQSFGYQLIRAFAKKLKARLNTFNDGGAVVDLLISKYKEI